MDKKIFEQLEADYRAKTKAYDDAEWELYDDQMEVKNSIEQAEEYIGTLQYQGNDPSLNFEFNRLMLELESDYEDFEKLIHHEEDLLEEYRWEAQKEFNKKTDEY